MEQLLHLIFGKKFLSLQLVNDLSRTTRSIDDNLSEFNSIRWVDYILGRNRKIYEMFIFCVLLKFEIHTFRFFDQPINIFFIFSLYSSRVPLLCIIFISSSITSILLVFSSKTNLFKLNCG